MAEPMPDSDDAPTAEELLPDEPPADAPTADATDRKPAVKPPVPTHGEMASREQLDEGERAVDLADQDSG